MYLYYFKKLDILDDNFMFSMELINRYFKDRLKIKKDAMLIEQYNKYKTLFELYDCYFDTPDGNEIINKIINNCIKDDFDDLIEYFLNKKYVVPYDLLVEAFKYNKVNIAIYDENYIKYKIVK